MKNRLIFSLIYIILFSCTNERQSDKSVINLVSITDKEIPNTLQSLKLKPSVIQLETLDSVLLGGNSIIKYLDRSNIIVESNQQLYRFDINGKYLNKIGQRGQGPNDYLAPGRVSYDALNEDLYLFNNKRLQIWSLEGQHIKNIDFPDKTTLLSISSLKNDTLIIIRREYGNEGEAVQTIQFGNLEGKIFCEKTMFADSTKIDIMMYATPEHYRIGTDEYIRNEWDNTLYKINYSNIEKLKELDFGSYTGGREHYQEGDLRKQLGNNKVNLTQCLFSNDKLWIKYRLDNKEHYLILNEDGEGLFQSIYPDDYIGPIGIRIVDELEFSFWPQYVTDDNILVSLIMPGTLNEEELSYIYDHFGVKITNEDNPILILLDYKTEF